MSAALLCGGRNREPSRDRLPLCFMSAIRKRRRQIFASTRCRLLKQRPFFSIHSRSPFPTRITRKRKIERSLLARLQNNGCCSFHIVSEETASV